MSRVKLKNLLLGAGLGDVPSQCIRLSRLRWLGCVLSADSLGEVGVISVVGTRKIRQPLD